MTRLVKWDWLDMVQTRRVFRGFGDFAEISTVGCHQCGAPEYQRGWSDDSLIRV